MPTVVVTQTVFPALAPMTALTGVDVQPSAGAIRFAWDDPPAAQGVTHILARVWLTAGGTRPADPTKDFGVGTPLPGGRSFGEVTGLPGGAYSWELAPGREE
jgi:hypothetical protein